ncbi:MAG: hypothetical protein HKN73_13810 [Gemmatimonadetes bacterium]|nr:hypothetical protein [Gemmatimonadota bacterium]
MERSELLKLALETLADYDTMMPSGPPDTLDEATVLFGPEGVFDSIGLVSFIAELEEAVNDEAGAEITIADERALSAEKSPFRSLGALVDHVADRLGDG